MSFTELSLPKRALFLAVTILLPGALTWAVITSSQDVDVDGSGGAVLSERSLSGPRVAAGVVPFWGVPDSTVEWCERNYETTPYIAEFWNTVSSLPMLLGGFYGAYRTTVVAVNERRFVLDFALLGFVGFGSTLFHATMRYSAQLLDELPMLYATAAFLYTLIEGDHVVARYAWLPYVGVAYSVLVSFIYVGMPELYWFFLLCYGGGILVITLLSVRRSLAPNTSAVSHRVLLAAATSYVVGTLLWVLENSMCERLPPWLRLHALWHLFAGGGTYLWIIWALFMRAETLRRRAQLKFEEVGCVAFVPMVIVDKTGSPASLVSVAGATPLRS